MLQSKVFYGDFHTTYGAEKKARTVDDEFNEWIKNHKDITIKDIQYKHSGSGVHSLFLLYEDPDICKFCICKLTEGKYYIDRNKLVRREDNFNFSGAVKNQHKFINLRIDWDGDFIEYKNGKFIKEMGGETYTINVEDAIKEEYL